MGFFTKAIWGRKAERTLTELRDEYRQAVAIEGVTHAAGALAEQEGMPRSSETIDLNHQAAARRVEIVRQAQKILAFMSDSNRPEKFSQAALDYLTG